MGRMQEVSQRRNEQLLALYSQTDPILTLDQIGAELGLQPGPNRKRVVNTKLYRLRKAGIEVPRRLPGYE